jgi:hypothetical protein
VGDGAMFLADGAVNVGKAAGQGVVKGTKFIGNELLGGKDVITEDRTPVESIIKPGVSRRIEINKLMRDEDLGNT